MGLVDLALKGGPVALTVLGFLFLWYVIGQMEKKFDKEIERLEKDMTTRIESRLNEMSSKIDTLTTNVTKLLTKGGIE